MYGVPYRCHPVSCLSDVNLLYKIDIPIPDRVQRAKDCVYATSQSTLLRVVEVVLLGRPWLLYVCPGLNQWIMQSASFRGRTDTSLDPTGLHLTGADVHNIIDLFRRALA